MKKTIIALLLLAVAIPAAAQTDVELDNEFGARLSVAADKKLTKGLHLRLEEEVRFDDNFGAFNRFHTTLGLSYKVNDYLKLGVGYALINPWDSDSNSFKSARHRLMLDATGSMHFGVWRLSLKERFQATYRSGDMNVYQNPRTALTLKSRLKLQYKGWRRFEPYTYLELRNTLNAPVIEATYNDATGKWGYYSGGTFYSRDDDNPGWFLDGFDGVYINRFRFAMGFDYRINRESSIDVCLLLDQVRDKVVDANAEGTKLKSYTREKGFVGWLAVGYKYAF
ncbi:MAG: DUF2490 domain-containing protein [Bacteroidales bacterium]|nr:DUF2490 domain-containing protein [Bacteroidales bacterium]